MENSTTLYRLNPGAYDAEPLKACLYAGISFAALLAFVCLGETDFIVVLSALLAIAAALVVQRSNRGRAEASYLTIFFWLAAGHAIYGYWAAGNSIDAIWIGNDADQMFRRSFFVVSTTLLVAAFAYDVALRFPAGWIRRFAGHISVSEEKLLRWARVCVLLGLLVIVYIIARTGYMPMLAENPGAARYMSDLLGTGSQVYIWVLQQGLNLATFAVPLVLVSGLLNRKKLDWVIGGLGVVAVLLTLERAYLISVFVVLLLTLGYVKGRFPRRYVASLVLLVAAYFGSQLVFMNAIGAGASATKTALLSALPEVRDLGLTMSLAGNKRFYGASFVAPMIVGPGIATSFKTRYALAYITLGLMGADGSAGGGLRITLAGEGYLNFGVLGCLIVGPLFGILCAALTNFGRALSRNRNLASGYLTASLFVWLCFWFYLGGTANASPIRNGLIGVLAMFFLARTRRRAVEPPLRAGDGRAAL